MHLSSIVVALGATLGLLGAVWPLATARQRAVVFEAGLAALAGALLGGRAVYVAVNGFYFADHLLEVPQVWLGGFSASGALAGALAGIGLAAARKGISLGLLADTLLPLLWTLSLAAWLAAWLEGVAYGRPLAAAWALPAKDEWGMVAARWPVQATGIVVTAVVAAALSLGRQGLRQAGLAAALGVLALSLQLLAAAFVRGDPMPTWLGLRLDAWGALASTALSTAALAALWLHPKRTAHLPPNGRGDHPATTHHSTV